MSRSTLTILGGGITGLSAAFHLSRRFPTCPITLLEKSNRLGGWIQSKRVQVDLPGGYIGNAMLELGPRTLRPQSRALLEMINLLDLKSRLIVTSKNSPAAKNRFLYLPDSRRPGLTPIPNSLIEHLTSRLSLITIPSVLREPFRRPNRPQAAEEDESFDSLMSRRFGPEFARVLGSSLIHGIYAADSRKLSVRSAMTQLWQAERMGKGSIVWGLYRSRSVKDPVGQEKYDTGGLEQSMKEVSVYSFRDGLQTLTNALTHKLKSLANVRIQTGCEVDHIHPVEDGFKISTSAGPLSTSHLVSTVPLPRLHSMLTDAQLPHLTANPSSSVTVVTFIFAASPSQIHPPGFGYLIPRPRDGYNSAENAEGILGVVFDSCSLGDQDQPTGHLTKLTVMLGGPYTQSDSGSSLKGHLLDTLQRQIGRRLPHPAHIEITHREQCIPIPTPGHSCRMQEVRHALEKDPFGTRMEVAGAGVEGVSVGDCVEQGRNVGKNWVL